jgi:hypothetical protein
MTMRQITAVLVFALMAGCMDAPQGGGINGPTGRAADAGKITAVGVRTLWKYDLKQASQDLVAKRLPYGSTAKFDDFVHFEGFFNATLNVTRVSVYGNVTTNTDYGTTDVNSYYVTWEQPGHVSADELPPWQIVDVQILNQPY